MVVKLVGKVNGTEITFERKSEERWETTVPQNINGIYIVEFQAIDDTGNIAYYANYLLAFSPGKKTVTLIPFPYFSRKEKEQYITCQLFCNYYAVLSD